MKKLLLAFTLLSASFATGAFADDFTLVGACTYSTQTEIGAVQVCEQAAVSAAVPADRIPAARDNMKQSCDGVQGAFATDACTLTNALGGCRGVTNEGAVQEVIVIYQGTSLTADQVKAECQSKGLEFFQP